MRCAGSCCASSRRRRRRRRKCSRDQTPQGPGAGVAQEGRNRASHATTRLARGAAPAPPAPADVGGARTGAHSTLSVLAQ